ncbi:type IV secretory system conjugative DNA transfer family protein [Caballeronia sp. GAWG1-1]|uniref:type IV secretory system conjugative DNA transfer family protein n=1 Tax=Caballeronia sp. GAWG1-1 TaxID=2921742 RepID=UPI002540487E|nr:type IV secretory system conjugative DNA transfer family protein [Caballeronia sp. GAWG1-1]
MSHGNAQGTPSNARLPTNCKVRSLFAPRVLEDSEEYSKMLGQFTHMAKSRGRSRGKSSSTSENLSEHGRPLMLPQELRALKYDKQIVTIEGCDPILCEKAFFYEDPELVDRLVQQSPYLQGVMARFARKNWRRAFWGLGPKLPSKAELEHAAFVLRELAAPVPKIEVEKWWHAQNAARRAQAGGGAPIRDVQEHEIGVLKASDLRGRQRPLVPRKCRQNLLQSLMSAGASPKRVRQFCVASFRSGPISRLSSTPRVSVSRRRPPAR